MASCSADPPSALSSPTASLEGLAGQPASLSRCGHFNRNERLKWSDRTRRLLLLSALSGPSLVARGLEGRARHGEGQLAGMEPTYHPTGWTGT